MKIRHLRLRDFRGYRSLDLGLKDGVLLFYGPNGAGKSNLAEAIYLLSTGRSFRTNEDASLIRHGEKEAFLEAELERGPHLRTISLSLGKEGKKFSLNGKPLRKLSELPLVAGASAFSPKDVGIFKGSPSNRRAFLDSSISREDGLYLEALVGYHKVLKDRNAALKAPSKDLRLIKALNVPLIKCAETIVRARSAFVDKAGKTFLELTSRLFGEGREVRLEYKPFVPLEDFTKKAPEYYEKNLEADMTYGMTTGGIHREDFRVKLDGKDAGEFASQGESRLLAIALRLIPCFMKEEGPLAILDDALSELDGKHSKALLGLLQELPQAILTGTQKEENATTIEIHDHQLKEVA